MGRNNMWRHTYHMITYGEDIHERKSLGKCSSRRIWARNKVTRVHKSHHNKSQEIWIVDRNDVYATLDFSLVLHWEKLTDYISLDGKTTPNILDCQSYTLFTDLAQFLWDLHLYLSFHYPGGHFTLTVYLPLV